MWNYCIFLFFRQLLTYSSYECCSILSKHYWYSWYLSPFYNKVTWNENNCCIFIIQKSWTVYCNSLKPHCSYNKSTIMETRGVRSQEAGFWKDSMLLDPQQLDQWSMLPLFSQEIIQLWKRQFSSHLLSTYNLRIDSVSSSHLASLTAIEPSQLGVSGTSGLHWSRPTLVDLFANSLYSISIGAPDWLFSFRESAHMRRKGGKRLLFLELYNSHNFGVVRSRGRPVETAMIFCYFLSRQKLVNVS